MIRHSYFTEQLHLLKNVYGEGVRVAANSQAVMVQNFKPPPAYKETYAPVVMDIPDGYGFGINIFDVWISLSKSVQKEHLLFEYREDQLQLALDALKINPKSNLWKHKSWYWLCLHVAGTKEYDDYTGKHTYSPDAIRDLAKMIGLLEHIRLIYVALDSIAKGELSTLRSLENMIRHREQIAKEADRLVEEFRFNQNWRRLRWMYE